MDYSELTKEERAILVTSDNHLTIDEIARRIGMSRRSVGVLLDAARRKLGEKGASAIGQKSDQDMSSHYDVISTADEKTETRIPS
jgi:DNA-binding CsgD family transcriptional regulator